jgi:uncharacterized protein with HEPN domain
MAVSGTVTIVGEAVRHLQTSISGDVKSVKIEIAIRRSRASFERTAGVF